MSNKLATYGKILDHIGAFGRFQQVPYLVLNLLIISQCCQKFLMVFVTDKPEWRCPVEEDASFLDPKTLEEGYPCLKDGTKCKNILFKTNQSSVTTEWELVCNKEYLLSFGQSIMLSGGLFGAIVFGGMSDKFGRKIMIIVMLSLAALSSFCSAFAQSYNQFILCRFLCEVFLTPGGVTIFVLLSEILGPSSKDLLLSIHQGFFSIGFVILATAAYLIPEWRNLTLVMSLPLVFGAISFLCGTVCESPQWLLEKGRLEESKQLLTEMAKTNSTEIPHEYLEELYKIDKNGNTIESDNSTRSSFAKEEFTKLIILVCVWFVFGLLYNGLSFSSKGTDGNKYISFSFSGIVEFPSLFFSIILMKIGQRKPMIYLVVFAGLSCFTCVPLLNWENSGYGFYVSIFLMLGKFGLTAAYNILYIFTAGLFSATLRNTSMSLCSLASRGGGAIAPLVIYLESYDKRLPMLVFGLACCSLTLLMLICPDSPEQQEELARKKVE